MWWRISKIFLSLTLAVIPIISKPALAENTTLQSTIVINELHLNGVGTGTTGSEFIELKNRSNTAVDISGWKLQYISSTGNLATAKYFVTFPADTVVYENGFILVSPDDYLTELSPKFTYAISNSFAGLAAAGGTVALVNDVAIAVDMVGWGTKSTTLCETELAAAPEDGQVIQRKIIDSNIADTDNNKADFEIVAEPTPETENTAPAIDPPVEPDPKDLPEEPVITPEPDVTPPTDVDSGAETEPVIEPEVPVPNPKPELPILLNELFIDPASPLTDANDEWVELYNPNDTSQDLTGYTLFAGELFTYKHIFTTGSIPAYGYIMVTSADTSIALANGSGAAKIIGPSGQMYDTTSYDAAKSNLSWAKDAGGQWQWTTTVTQLAQNIITVPTVAEKIVATAAAKKVATTKTTAAKTSTPKATATKVTKVKAATATSNNEPSLVDAPSPLPIPLLATLGLLALLYSTYEYRFDIANKIYQLRNYRTNRP